MKHKSIFKAFAAVAGLMATCCLAYATPAAMDPINYNNLKLSKQHPGAAVPPKIIASKAEDATRQGITPRIIGGNDASIDNWPFIVALIEAGLSPDEGQFCGGSLIKSDVVLTAAHCVFGASPEFIQIVTGTESLANALSESETIDVERIVVHEEYDPFTLNNDIALIYLTTPSTQPTVDIVPAAEFNEVNFGVDFSVAGWGTTDPFESFPPETLQEVSVNYIDTEICNDAYLDLIGPDAVTEAMICAGTSQGGFDSCFGDSGGPLVREVDGTVQQVGIVSWGNPVCGEQNFYGVYSKAAHFEDWLEAKLSRLIELNPVADSQLQLCIAEQAAVEGATKLNELTSLSCEGFGISSLNGVEQFSNLDNLNLAQNSITDLSPLSQLESLQFLDLSFNIFLSDVISLISLDQLAQINLFGTSIDCIDTNFPASSSDLEDACATPIADISFDDPALRECVLGFSSQNDLKSAELVTELACQGREIASLEGIEALTQLVVLDLFDNQITDLEPLSGLTKLETLILWENKISDITPLTNLTNLVYLDLDANEIRDISALEFLTSLETVWLVNNPIVCFSPDGPISHAEIPLNCFEEIVTNPLADLVFDPALKQCVSEQATGNNWTNPDEVTSLFCNDRGINDIEGLENFFNLRELNLFGNNISNIWPLANLFDLELLSLGSNSVFEIDALSSLFSLQLLGLESNPFSDISPLEGLVNLQEIYLANLPGVLCVDGEFGPVDYETLANACFNFEPFETLVSDPALDQCLQQEAEFSGWTTIEDVTAIDCSGQNIDSLSGLENYSNLNSLIIVDNNVSDLSPISGLPLQHIDILSNNISSLVPLEGMEQIFLLITSDNPIECTDQGIFFSYFEIPETCFNPEPPAEQDTDGDGVVDSLDNCPTKPNTNQKDTDKDGLGNKCDSDDDNDGFSDAEENRAGSNPRNPNSTPESILFDADSDGILDFLDNCPNKANANQKDFDLDGQGNVCDIDDDNDGFTDAEENNAGSNKKDPNSTPITVIVDWDNDGILDTADNCPLTPNANQKDSDRDGLGNKCDPDNDNDGFTDAEENNAGSDPRNPNSTPETLAFDADGDTIPNTWDNCIDVPNANQKDADQDGFGNACDPDDDNDGFTDIEENLAGTGPKNPASFPII